MDEMMRQISAFPNGTLLRISWDSGKAVIEGILDTIYETDNGTEIDEEQYQEFYACAVLVQKVVRNLSGSPLAVNTLIEVSIENQPSKIELADGMVNGKNEAGIQLHYNNQHNAGSISGNTRTIHEGNSLDQRYLSRAKNWGPELLF